MAVRTTIHRRLDWLVRTPLETPEQRAAFKRAWKNFYLELTLAIRQAKSLRYPEAWEKEGLDLIGNPSSFYQSKADRLRMYAKQAMGIRKRLWDKKDEGQGNLRVLLGFDMDEA